MIGRGEAMRVVVGLFMEGGVDTDLRVLMALRPYAAARGGMWEYPGGKVEPGESDRAALEREMLEELGCRVYVGGEVDRTTLDLEMRFEIILYACTLIDTRQPKPLASLALAWVDPYRAIIERPLVPSCYLFYPAICRLRSIR